MEEKCPAMVLLSGGQDSATCLAMVKYKYDYEKIYTVSFNYSQRHKRELECAKMISSIAEVKKHFTIPISSLQYLGASALLNKEDDVSAEHSINSSLPASFVPGRNMLFLTLAAAKAYQLGVKDIFTGVCQTDFSGYPDCRDTSIKAVQVALNLCFDYYDFSIFTPLMWKTKAETVLQMKKLDCLNWYKYTHTCYNGEYPPCGECPACKLRAKGFKEAGIEDPLFFTKTKRSSNAII